MNKRSVGAVFELMAENWMNRNGFTLLHKNWQDAHREIDLIMENAQKRVFIEVKSSSARFNGFPEDKINGLKKKHLIKSMNTYNDLYPTKKQIQWDIIAITQNQHAVQIFHMKDAFFGIKSKKIGNRLSNFYDKNFNAQRF
jgi:putative endonuclease